MSQSPTRSLYTGKIVVDPITRIEGHLRIETEVEHGRVRRARCVGTLFRGLEIILRGRDPRDVPHFTQRTCGVCTYVHALASIRALEDAIRVPVPRAATLIRNLVLGMQFLHDHIVHFYHLNALDYVDVTAALKADPQLAAKRSAEISEKPLTVEALRRVQQRLQGFVDGGQLGIFTNAFFLGGHPAYILDPETDLILTAHYLEALRIQVLAARAMAVFGGKNPHPQFMIPGGVTCYASLTDARLAEFEQLYRATRNFVDQAYIPDLRLLAEAYVNLTTFGDNRHFMTFGEFPGDERKLDSRWLKPGVIFNRDVTRVHPVNPDVIAEHVRHSWYRGHDALHPYEGETTPQFTFMGDEERYTWLKAPRYQDLPMETGPLAQMLVGYAQGDPDILEASKKFAAHSSIPTRVYLSTMGRTVARGIETLVISEKIPAWLDELRSLATSPTVKLCEPYAMPKSAKGVGFVTAPRGGLSHWIVIEKGKVANFQLVVPSTWNFGPRDEKGIPGPVENALIGTPIADPARPVEILRTVHSFDPCLACAVHVLDTATDTTRSFQIL